MLLRLTFLPAHLVRPIDSAHLFVITSAARYALFFSSNTSGLAPLLRPGMHLKVFSLDQRTAIRATIFAYPTLP